MTNSAEHGEARTPTITLIAACAGDFEALLALRTSAMRASLERIGRFDPARARARFQLSFTPQLTRHVLAANRRVGFIAIKPQADGLLLDHLYIHPDQQGRGLGSAVLATIFEEADAAGQPIRAGALRDSDSNRFYERHGFVRIEEAEFDIYYVRPAPRRASGT